MELNSLFKKLKSNLDYKRLDKVSILLNSETKVYDQEYVFPNRGGDVAITWYLFGKNVEYLYLCYYSVVTFLRKTDLQHFDRYICVPDDYDFMEYMPLFESLGFKVDTSSYHFKALKGDSKLVEKYDYIVTLDTDIFAFDKNDKVYNYFEGFEELVSAYKKIGVKLPYMCVALNTGFGHHINRFADLSAMILDNPEDTLIGKYIWGSDTYNESDAYSNIITESKSDDLLFIINHLVEFLDIPFESDISKKMYVENAYIKFLCHPWPVNEIFSYPTNIFKQHGIHDLINKIKAKRQWFWDDELVYKLYYTFYMMDDTISFNQLVGYNHYYNDTNRVHAGVKDKDLKDDKLYFTHPFHEIDINNNEMVETVLKRIVY